MIFLSGPSFFYEYAHTLPLSKSRMLPLDFTLENNLAFLPAIIRARCVDAPASHLARFRVKIEARSTGALEYDTTHADRRSGIFYAFV